MSLLSHIEHCNRHDPSRFVRWEVDGATVGWIRCDHLPWLDGFSSLLRLDADCVRFQPFLNSVAARTAALAEICEHLADNGPFPPLRNEAFAVISRWGEKPLCLLDRAYASFFGIRAFGLHVNGVVSRPDGLHLWIARRAADRPVEPGKLDNMIAGGQPAGLSLAENLCKEAAEEAGIAADLAQTARPVSIIRYCMEDEWGLKPDTLFCFDLPLASDFIPRNTDGEIESFTLTPVNAVINRVRTGQEFKFNVNLVLIDLFLRYGLLHPDSEPDYEKVACGLRPSAVLRDHSF